MASHHRVRGGKLTYSSRPESAAAAAGTRRMSRRPRAAGAICGSNWSDSPTEVAVTVTPGVYGE
ncbi:hypothetical protein GCM10027074_13000 [Streptomyces deserti]